MADDPENYLPVPGAYADPNMLRQAWAQTLRAQTRAEPPKFAPNWAGALAGVLTGIGENRQLAQLGGMMRGSGLPTASTVPSLPSTDADTPAVGHPDQPLTNGGYGPNPPGSTALDPTYVNAVMGIESGGDVNAKSGSNRGLFQFGPEEEKRYGINDSNRTSTDAQRDAFERANVDYTKDLTKAGVPVTPGNLYVRHQQGVAGGPALLTADPNKPAWQALRDVGVSEGKAKASIRNNLYPGMPGYGLPDDQITAGQFTSGWNQKVARRMGGGGQAAPGAGPTSTFAGSPAPTAGPSSGAPAPSVAGQGQDPASRVEPAGQFLPADPRARQEYQAAQTRAQQLKRFPYGSPEHQEGIRLEEELQKQRLAPPQTITDPRTGRSQLYSPLTGGRDPGLPRQLTPGEAEGIASETKSAHTTLTGIRGLGVTGSNLEPYTAAALKIVNDPSFQQTGLVSADNQLLLERLKKQFNLPSSATPIAVLNQIRATALNSMQSGAKSFATEGGEAARLFQSEIETMKGELPPANATADEQIAGWNAVHRRAGKWADDALYFNDWAKHQPSGLPTSDIHSELIRRNRAFQPYYEGVEKPTAQSSFNQRFGDWNTGPGNMGTAPSPTSGLQPGQAIPAASFAERSRNITRKANENAGPGAALATMAGGGPLLTGAAAAGARAAGMSLPKIIEVLMHGAATTGAIGAANKLWPGH